MELLFVYIYCLLSLFALIRGHILRLEMLIKGQPLTLPDGVAFKLGGNETKSVIIQGTLLFCF